MGKLGTDQLVGRLVAIVVAVLLVGGGVTFTATAQADETLVQKLVTLFRGHAQTEIDDAVAQAKEQLGGETKQAKRNDLEKLFASQIATLKDRGVPAEIVKMLENQKDAVVKKASKLAIGNGNIPFLPVIPQSYHSLYDFMALVRNENKVGYTNLNPTRIHDMVSTPRDPYYIYDVEDGEATRGKSPQVAMKTFKQTKWSPLTAAEVVALCTHTNVLSMHYVWAAGSCYDRSDSAHHVRAATVCLDNYESVPRVWLKDDKPLLDWSYRDFDDSRWGTASCGSR